MNDMWSGRLCTWLGLRIATILYHSGGANTYKSAPFGRLWDGIPTTNGALMEETWTKILQVSAVSWRSEDAAARLTLLRRMRATGRRYRG